MSLLARVNTPKARRVLWWVAHALPRDPGHVFDAPIFVPERRTLAYSEPLLVPAGSRIINRWTYDNSKRNFANPAPEKEVTFGQQSWDEMLTFFIHYRWVGESVAQPMDSLDRVMQQGHLMGVLDDNMDGKLQLAELRGTQAEWLKTNFATLEKNGDGAYSYDVI